MDEAQDLTPARRATTMLLGSRGRILAVGDEAQAIYGFAGGESDSIAKIRENMRAAGAFEQFALSISRRCPKAVIRFVVANTRVKDIEAAPDAEEGLVSTDVIFSEDLRPGPGDAILCRLNAPLLRLAFALVLRGIAVKITGPSWQKALVRLITEELKAKKCGEVEVGLDRQAQRLGGQKKLSMDHAKSAHLFLPVVLSMRTRD